MALPGQQSLKSQVSRWENGHVVPESQYRRLLREVYGLDDRDLGFDDDGNTDQVLLGNELRTRLARAARLDASTLTVLVAQTDALRQLDRVQGAAYVLDQLRAHIDHLETLRHHSTTPDVRVSLSAALSDASSLAGWQALDMGALGQSWHHFERAKDAGREASSTALGAFALAEQAFVLLDLGELDSAAAQLDYAIGHCKTSASLRLKSWLYATRAEMAAGAGDRDACKRYLDRATHELPDGLVDEETPYILLDTEQLERWRGHCLAICGLPDAVAVLQQSLRTGGLSVRAEAGLRADLAAALSISGEPDALLSEVDAARKAAERAGSVRQRRRLEALLTG